MILSPETVKSVSFFVACKGQLFLCLVDEQDFFAIIAKHTWSLSEGYLRTKIKGKDVRLHKLILPNSKLVDHRNRNKLDNRRKNLKETSYAINAANQDSLGVYQIPCGNWEARISRNKKTIHLGTYPTFEWARKAFLQAKLQFYGIVN